MFNYIDEVPDEVLDYVDSFFDFRSNEQQLKDLADLRADMIANGLNPDEEVILPF